MPLTFKEVAEILKIIDASECEEVVLELEGVKLSVRKGAPDGPQSAAAGPALSEDPSPSPASPFADASHAGTQRAQGVAGEGEVRAPMVGTFYRRPGPDKPPFVEIGSEVRAGDGLCLIEVMKLYTTIEAPHSGTVAQIAAEDGQLVEFDQLLFVIEPD